MTDFVRASALYDVESREPLRFDWDKGQPLAESQAEIDRALSGALEDTYVGR